MRSQCTVVRDVKMSVMSIRLRNERVRGGRFYVQIIHKYVRRFHMKYFPNIIDNRACTAFADSNVKRVWVGFATLCWLAWRTSSVLEFGGGGPVYQTHPFGPACRSRVPAKRYVSRGKFEGSHETFVGYCLAYASNSVPTGTRPWLCWWS